MSLNFGWILDHRLAGSRGPRSNQDLIALKNQGIGALVRLVEPDETLLTTREVNNAGSEDYDEPVRDFKASTQGQINRNITYIDAQLERGVPVGVSCYAGIGRTGVMLACYLVHRSHTAEESMELLRKKRG
jgi:atypical dual specificity phosphatase